MGLSNCLEVLSQSGCESRRKHGGPVFPALSISDGDLVLTEVNVFYPQSQPLHQAHSRPIEKGQEEMVGPAEAGKDGSNLVSRQNDGKPAPSLRPDPGPGRARQSLARERSCTERAVRRGP